jgi:hypothetical protein
MFMECNGGGGVRQGEGGSPSSSRSESSSGCLAGRVAAAREKNAGAGRLGHARDQTGSDRGGGGGGMTLVGVVVVLLPPGTIISGPTADSLSPARVPPFRPYLVMILLGTATKSAATKNALPPPPPPVDSGGRIVMSINMITALSAIIRMTIFSMDGSWGDRRRMMMGRECSLGRQRSFIVLSRDGFETASIRIPDARVPLGSEELRTTRRTTSTLQIDSLLTRMVSSTRRRRR